MSSRPYTAIMMINGKVVMADVMAPLRSDEARVVLEEAYPSCQLLSLIPGTHTQHSYIYNDEVGSRGCTQNVDPFDMAYAYEKTG
tara:strand:- start:26 stop:280 length:255 start_codon:yes stop_codon:yes gene_type:complete